MVLKKKGNRYALVSKSNPDKVLKWFGTKKPSKEEVRKEERRVQFFKAVSAGKIPKSKIRVKKHTRRTKKGRVKVRNHSRKR